MTLNPDNDIYQGDLGTLNQRKQAWSSADKSSSKYRIGAWIIVAVGFACIVYVYTRVKDDPGTMGQLPLHLSIWITSLAAIFTSRHGKKHSEKPFAGFHMARFEVDDTTLYYVFQKGMTLRTYYIKDEDIQKIYRDDEAGVLLIEGDAKVNVQARKTETEHSVSEFYALIPFDKYDLDDLLKPYKKKVEKANGKLRAKYLESNA